MNSQLKAYAQRYKKKPKWIKDIRCFSGPNTTCNNITTGDEKHNNVAEIMKNMLAYSKIGNDQQNCNPEGLIYPRPTSTVTSTTTMTPRTTTTKPSKELAGD